MENNLCSCLRLVLRSVVRPLQEAGARLEARRAVPQQRPHPGGKDRLHEVPLRQRRVQHRRISDHLVVSSSSSSPVKSVG